MTRCTPQQNGFCGSIDGSLRDECRNEAPFASLSHAARGIPPRSRAQRRIHVRQRRTYIVTAQRDGGA
ncbi:transposase [Sphingosinicellaceae bacterium]|nr:transposase [Sphingosinicellaceae bacterium]